MLNVYTSAMVRLAAPLVLALAVASTAAAQTTRIGTADIERLQNDVFQAGSDISRLHSTDPDAASRLQTQLDDLSDEVIYLKVKLRRVGSVTRAEYTEVRNRLTTLRTRARGDLSGRRETLGTGGTRDSDRDRDPVYRDPVNRDPVYRDDAPRRQTDGSIPVGQEIDVRLQTLLSSDTAQVEDRFEATTVVDLYSGNRVLIPAGSVMRGVVRSVDKASRTERKGSLMVSFDQVTIDGRTYPMRGTVLEALESEGLRGEAPRIGAGGAVGAIIGGILGGVKGAVIGATIGAGGTIAATEGKDVHLQPGTILRVRLDTPPAIR
jgi:hypothetical protein